jgi:O-antigen/teichoic acid export membrane protein/glycosyltransferase involved in cell wall biosynthesis/peptidoglycan/xylan/chitin deacetylase (PgdA/CDA1 family)/polysaccharide pyruvyl transferase WcaK-like protein
MTTIRRKAAIQFFASNGATVVNFFLSVVMARLLTPAEIGIFSITAVVVSVSHVFRDFGVASFLKREKTLTPEILSAATGVLITSSWTIATLLYVSSGYVAEYFGQPGIYDVMRVLAVGFYFIPFGSIPQALLQRRLETEKTAIVTAISTLVYAVTCITLASLGFSYMTMAWANLINIIVTGLALMALRPRDLPWFPSIRGWGRVAHFGLGSMLSSTLTAVDNAIPDTLLGKMSNPHNVGLFSRANSTVNIFNHISGPTIGYMALPYLAKSHHDGRDLAAEVGIAIAYLTGLIWPALAVTAVMAPDIIQLLYGTAWLECAAVIPILAIACGVQAAFAFMVPALTGIGRPYWSALPLAFSVTAKVGLALVIFDGTLVSFAWAVAIGELFSVPGHLYLARKFIKLKITRFVQSVSGGLAIAFVVFACVELLYASIGGIESPLLRLLVVLVVILPTWIAAVVFFRHPLQREWASLWDVLVSRWKLRRIVAEPKGLEEVSPRGNSISENAHSSSEQGKVLIYGVLARQDDSSQPPSLGKVVKRFLHQLIDRSAWAFGSTSRLDYRNYDSATTSNVGDIAIAEATRGQFAAALGHHRFTNLNWGELSTLAADEIDATHDLIVIAGSGYLFFDQDGRLAGRIADDLQILDRLTIPVVLHGIGVNRNSDRPIEESCIKLSVEDEKTLRHLLERSAYISVRDTASQQLLSPYTPKTVSLIGDPALWLPGPQASPNSDARSDSEPQIKVGINFPFHGLLPNQQLRRNLATYVRILKEIRSATGCRFSYFVHYDAESLIPHLLAQKGIFAEIIRGTPDQLSRAYSELDLHIGGMLHSCILATGAGVPCIGLAYDVKHIGFFDLMNVSRYCFSATSLDSIAIVRTAIEAIQDGVNIRVALAERRQFLREATQRFVRECITLAPRVSPSQALASSPFDASQVPTVSVILPVRNCKDYIQEALDSILQQDFEDYEILIVDDGSNDFDYHSLATLDPRIRVLRQEATGVSSARNRGMCTARGKYLAFLDADDVWFPGKLTAQLRYFDMHPETGVVYGEFIRWKMFDDGSCVPAERLAIDCSGLSSCNQQRSGWLYSRLMTGLLVGMNTAVIRREVKLQVGDFDESLTIGEDHDFWLRVSRVTRMDALDGPVALYRIHAQSAIRRLDRRNNYARVLELARTRWGLSSPDGSQISEDVYRARLASSYFDHGYNHFWHGNSFVAREAFRQCLRARQMGLKARAYFAAATLKAKLEFSERHSFPHLGSRAKTLPSAGDGRDIGSPSGTPIAGHAAGFAKRRVILSREGAPAWAHLTSSLLRSAMTGGNGQALTIFTFHNVPVQANAHVPGELCLKDFEQLIEMLCCHFNLMSVEEGRERLRAKVLPPFSAAITFDDGYPDWMTGVVPLLESRRIPATFFIATGQLEGQPLWFERVNRVLRFTALDRSELYRILGEFGLVLESKFAIADNELIRLIKFLPPMRRDEVIRACETDLGLEGSCAMFSAHDVRALSGKGFSIGAHTVSHPILSSCSDHEARAEILGSKEMLEDILREPVTLFAYPNGVPGIDVKPQHVRMVREAGFAAAVTTAAGSISSRTSDFQLPRLDPWARTPSRFMIQYLLSLRRSVPNIPEEAS